MSKESREYDMNFADITAILIWVAGVVVANAGWSTFFAIVFPPWAFYVLIEHFFRLGGLL